MVIIMANKPEQSNLGQLKELATQLNYQRKLAQIVETVPNSEMFQEIAIVLQKITSSEFGLVSYISENKDALIASALGLPMMMEQCCVDGQDIVFTKDTLLQMPHWGRFWRGDLTPFYENNSAEFQVPNGHISVENFMLVPIMFSGGFIGTIALANCTEGYTDTTLKMMVELAEYLAPIFSVRIERDRLSSKVVQEFEYLKSLLEESNKKQENLSVRLAHVEGLLEK